MYINIYIYPARPQGSSLDFEHLPAQPWNPLGIWKNTAKSPLRHNAELVDYTHMDNTYE